jgi:lysophospholipase L1-like esterase
MGTLAKILFYFMTFFLSGCLFEHEESELCFVGDSITHRWDIEDYFPGYAILKHAVGGAIVQDMDKWDLTGCIDKPVVILMGTNNIGFTKLEDPSAASRRELLVEQYMTRIKRLQARETWVISILPRNYKGQQSITVNQHLEIVNLRIKSALDSLGINSHFVNVFQRFLIDDYTINEDLFVDGLHPNRQGYEILAEEIHKRL